MTDDRPQVFVIQKAESNGSGIRLRGGRVITAAYPNMEAAFKAVRGKSHVDLAWYEDLSEPDRARIDEAFG